jgi:hypothetical protein
MLALLDTCIAESYEIFNDADRRLFAEACSRGVEELGVGLGEARREEVLE